jgi:ankyrin repeat protein
MIGRIRRLQQIEELIQDSIDNNLHSLSGYTPMHLAVELNNVHLVQNLIKNGFNINNAIDANGYMPMHLAVFIGNIDMINLLINSGADLNVDNYMTGETPMHFAAFHGDQDLFEFLLEHNGDYIKADKKGNTPLDNLLIGGFSELFLKVVHDDILYVKKILPKHLIKAVEISKPRNFTNVINYVQDRLQISW